MAGPNVLSVQVFLRPDIQRLEMHQSAGLFVMAVLSDSPVPGGPRRHKKNPRIDARVREIFNAAGQLTIRVSNSIYSAAWRSALKCPFA